MADDKEKEKDAEEVTEGAEEATNEPDFEDFEEDEGLDSTMMDIDLKDLDDPKEGDDKTAESTPKAPDGEESVEDLLKKKKSLLGKLGLKK